MKYLLPPVPKYFKTNLHTHSTISDGQLSPQELKELYKKNGYQILTITDHNVIADHSALSDADFLMLTGVEIALSEEGKDVLHKKSYHINLISRRPDNLWQPTFPRKPRESSLPYLALVESPNMKLSYSVDNINEIIARSNEHDFLVMYNHPVWSLQNYTDYAGLKGLWAMDICNYNDLYVGHDPYFSMVYRDLLALGNRIFPVGCDDMHTTNAYAGSWIMVGAEALTYGSVIDALEKGDFYASTGPEIHSLTVDGSVLKITCSGAHSISLASDCRFVRHVYAADNGTPLQEATFDLTKWIESSQANGLTDEAYIRLTVYGPAGHRAYTRAYYLTELL